MGAKAAIFTPVPPRFEDVYTGKPILYAIHRDSVLACNVSKFLATFDITRIAAAGKLRELRGILHLAISGWDDDPRSLHEVPEVRTFVQELDRKFPFLAYAATTQTETLRIMSLCLVPMSMTQRSSVEPEAFKATYDTREYREILDRWFKNFDHACVLARTFTLREHAQVSIELANYFGLEWYWKK